MPLVVQNAWMELRTSDGRDVSAGPRRADGDLEAVLFVRDDGTVRRMMDLRTGPTTPNGSVLVGFAEFPPGVRVETLPNGGLRVGWMTRR